MPCDPAKRSLIVGVLLFALPACDARLPESKYRCDKHADCRPELPYCVPNGPDGIRVCSSERGETPATDGSVNEEEQVDAVVLDPEDSGPEGGAKPAGAGAHAGGAGGSSGGGGAAASNAADGGGAAAGSNAAGGGAAGEMTGASGGGGSSGAGGAPPPVVATTPAEPVIVEEPAAYIKADSAQAQRYFGTGLALHGDLLVVGAPYDDVAETTVRYSSPPLAASGAAEDAGAAYVYRSIAGRWTFEACLAVPNGRLARFARSVAIDDTGTRIVVGVWYDGSSNQRVFLYRRDAQQRWVPHWSEGLVDPPLAAGFGAAVAIHGNTLVVGAPDVLPDVPEDVPDAFVYRLDDSGVAEQPPVRLTPPGADRSTRFGDSVATWGDAIVVGAPYMSDKLKNAGAAFLYRRDSASQQWSTAPIPLRAPRPDAYDDMGLAVAIDHAYVAVGAPGTQPWLGDTRDDTRLDQGAVHLFDVQTAVYAGTAQPVEEGTKFGRMGSSVALDGDRLIAGAPGRYMTHAMAGKAYVFRHGAWDQPAAILRPPSTHGDPRDGFGAAVGMSGGLVAAGSPNEDSKAIGIDGDARDNSSEDNGAVYVFALDAP